MDAVEDLYRKLAREVAEQAMHVIDEPPLGRRPARLADLPHLDAAWYERTSAALTAAGHRALADLDASAVVAPGCPTPMVRVFLDDSGTTSTALFHIIPKSPGMVVKLLARVMGKWAEPRIIECWTWLDDAGASTSSDGGLIVTTANIGALSSFSAPPWFERRALPVDAPLAAVLAAHNDAVEDARSRTGGTARRFTGFDDLDAARDENRLRANRWRRSIGGLLPEEIDRMLVPHGTHGDRVRLHLERELAARVAVLR